MKFKIKLFKRELIFVAQNKPLGKKESLGGITLNRSYNKVFCIGMWKTGTTSVEAALKEFGFKLGHQRTGEILSEDWATKRIDRILKYCKSADAFQDSPFPLKGLFKELDKAFPNSKFILTVRDDENQWFNSLIKFHAKRFSSDKANPPTEMDLKNADYIYPGWALDMKKAFWNYPNVKLYDEDYYKKQYIDHNQDVVNYFKGRENDLLVLNVAEEKSYQKLAAFLNIEVSDKAKFPWLNKT